MTPDLMNQLSTLGQPQTMTRPNNTVLIRAGDTINGMTTVFVGQLNHAYQKIAQPDLFFQIDCWTGQLPAMVPVTPTSYPGSFDVVTAMATFAAKLNMAFENNGVQVRMPSSYFAGNHWDQVMALAKAANIEACFDSVDSGSANKNATLAIWPKTGCRGGAIPLIQASSELIGYPEFEQYGISLPLYLQSIAEAGRRGCK